MIYLIGSLRHERVEEVARQLRSELDVEVFDCWRAAGPDADDAWRRYSMARGQDFASALQDYPARHVFLYDKEHIDRADAVVLVLPAGRSGHLELGYALGQGKPGFVLLDDPNPERWDVMYRFADAVTHDVGELLRWLHPIFPPF